MKWTLICFDDSPENIDCYQMLLKDKFDIIACLDATKYESLMEEHCPHAFLLDVHMPVLDGHELYQKLISHPKYNSCPIIFISGDVSEETRLRSHDLGGLDFLSRDIDADEFESRVVSKIRLYQKTASYLTVGNLLMNFEELKVFIHNQSIDLTLIEMRILTSLIRNIPDSIHREELVKMIWKEAKEIKPGNINVHVSNLKTKLKDWNHTLLIRQDNVQIKKKDQ